MLELLVHWLLATLTLLAVSHVVPGMEVKSFVAALVAAVVIGIVNAVIWPILAILTLPLSIVTFGLFLLVVNALCLKISAGLTPGFSIDGFLPAVIGSVALAILGWLVRFVFFRSSHVAG